ncbi:ABC transporter ATP-binding protein [Tepidanaerobacter sp. GT38]|uniref:ABC transporter ATP-binding protein n=1 Tax=Tepidanaerobacter sp. GT38 TaxID=2722793 RepID=UPI001F18DC52|nr:ABC transporter ATP-binding protein [Tepidanaerobacter sp. GT38]MCG1012346.1 ABC transporter ATP-binding protein [Tepidanaerobacter sp. GT38]
MLTVENLSVTYYQHNLKVHAVKEISFVLEPGQTLGIIGESGSGKTTLGLAIMGILNPNAKVNGKISYNGVNLRELSSKQLNKYRWKHIAMVFQNGLETLNPLLTVKEQIMECVTRHLDLSIKEANKRVIHLLEQVGLEPFVSDYFPHQLSGGMRQKVLIAMALACEPKILIVDEPTSSLDAISKAEIVRLLAKVQREKRFSMIVISHDFSVISSLTSKMCVMYRGSILEEGLTRDILNNPMHTYTRGLINSSPSINPFQDLWGIPAANSKAGDGCPFYPRCSQRLDVCKDKKPKLEYVSLERRVACNQGGIVTLLEASGIYKTFIFKGRSIVACNNCHITVRAGEIVALIGQSGSGKTTLASILSGYLKPDKGIIKFLGQKVSSHELTCRPKGLQMIFQDPFSSINEGFTVLQAVTEPLDILKLYSPQERKEKAKKALFAVELPVDENFLQRRCFTLSGGQRQRVSIARSLILEPRLLIADEISSMLDPSTQANILRLLKGLQNSFGFAMIYITHDLNLARKIADKLYIMHQGEIIEQGPAGEVFKNPSSEYAKQLINSADLL